MRRTISRVNDWPSEISGWLMLSMMGILLVDIVWQALLQNTGCQGFTP